MTFQHGGNINKYSQESGIPRECILDFSANINPLGPPEWLRSVVSASLHSIVNYPDPDCEALIHAAAKRYACNESEIAAGNGSTELLFKLPNVIQRKRVIIVSPTYVDYSTAFRNCGIEVKLFELRESDDFVLNIRELEELLTPEDCVVICNPNNPTGLFVKSELIHSLANRNPKTAFLIDEAFGDFIEAFDSITVNRPRNVIALLSLTKIFAVPGLRVGLAVAKDAVIKDLKQSLPNWTVNSIAQSVAERALADRDYVIRSQKYVRELRGRLTADLRKFRGLTVYPGKANFLLIRLDPADVDSGVLAEKLLKQGIAIRQCGNFDGLDNRFIRIAVKTEQENILLIERLSDLFSVPKPHRKKKTPAIMFQGTSSNAGKSVLTAAMCRILLQDGYNVAPFKSQNMSLNSYVTKDGGEMGRAQVVQAQACRLDPDVRMNPILLKPNSDTGSQVIVLGKPVGNMNVGQYIHYKKEAFGAVREAFDSLAAEHDIIVLEGAGSPAEVNLKSHDIVNMRMAQYAEAPVLLTGDIDRGGVFASFIGTMETLAEWERNLIAGFIINRFRGDGRLLKDAIDYTFNYTGRPTLGVVPYISNHGLPEEDSVSFKGSVNKRDIETEMDKIEIAVIDLPHISNFTDFDAFQLEPDVKLTIVRNPADLNSPDAIIIPGTKNTIGDLEYLVAHDFPERINKLCAVGTTEVVGICGGFQMIGAKISDPHSLESNGKGASGLNFLNMETVLAKEKTLTRFTGRHIESGKPISGYEIHHGLSSGEGANPVIENERGEIAGAQSPSGLIWGTYVHGIFDTDEFRRWFIDKLRIRRGLQPIGKIEGRYDIETALDRVAHVVRASLDMKAVMRLLRR